MLGPGQHRLAGLDDVAMTLAVGRSPKAKFAAAQCPIERMQVDCADEPLTLVGPQQPFEAVALSEKAPGFTDPTFNFVDFVIERGPINEWAEMRCGARHGFEQVVGIFNLGQTQRQTRGCK